MERYVEGCPDGRKGAIGKFSDNILFEDGVLFYLQYNDDDLTGGCHLERDKSRDKVASRYFWYGRYDYVGYYIKTCHKCQKVLLSS